ncbi:MAG: hypothetical protein QM724_10895 [Flavobacteriales bacterium]
MPNGPTNTHPMNKEDRPHTLQDSDIVTRKPGSGMARAGIIAAVAVASMAMTGCSDKKACSDYNTTHYRDYDGGAYADYVQIMGDPGNRGRLCSDSD